MRPSRNWIYCSVPAMPHSLPARLSRVARTRIVLIFSSFHERPIPADLVHKIAKADAHGYFETERPMMFCSTTLAVMSLFGLANAPPMTGPPAHIGKYPFEQVECLSFFEEPLVSKAIADAAGDD